MLTNRLKLHIFFSPEGFGGGSGSGNGNSGSGDNKPNGIVDVQPVGRPGQLPAGTDERAFLDNFGDKPDKKEKKEDKEEKDEIEGEGGEEEGGEENAEEGSEEEDGEEDGEGEDEEESEEEEDEEGEEVDETDLEDDSVYQALKKHDKDIFKKVPGLRATVFREQQFTKYFATPADAEEAYKKADALGNFEVDLRGGNSEKLVEFLQQEKALRKFGTGLLKTIQSADKDTFFGIIAPEFKQFFRHAMRDPNDAIKNSAKNLHYFFFGNHEYDKDEGLVPETKSQRELDLEKREKEINENNSKAFMNDVVGSSKKRAMRLIEKSFENVDITDWHKSKLVEDIYSRVVGSMDRDVRYSGMMRGLLNKAAKDGFTSEGKESVLSAFLSRAKLLIPTVRAKVLKEARIEAKAAEGDKKKRKAKRVPSSSSSTPGGKKKFDPKVHLKPGMSERDILDGNF